MVSVILEMVQGISPVIWIAAGGVLFLIAVFIVYRLLAGAYLERIIGGVANPERREEVIQHILERYPEKKLLHRPGPVIAAARRWDTSIPMRLGLDKKWIERLEKKGRKSDFNLVLEFSPEKGLFGCFRSALEKPKYGKKLLQWFKEQSDLISLRKIALSGPGRSFDGAKAYKLFSEYIHILREMMGDPEWASRYFGLIILLHDNEERSKRTVWDALYDPHPLVRKTMLLNYVPNDRETFYTELRRLYLEDPVYEVRNSAKKRIKSDYADMPALEPKSLSDIELIHFLELLDTKSNADMDVAFTYACSKNLEYRLLAVRHLQKSGILHKLFKEDNLVDSENLDRTFQILRCACEVQVTGFLSAITSNKNPAMLWIASKLLSKYSNRRLTEYLYEGALNLYDKGDKDSKKYKEIFNQTVECIQKRGTDKVLMRVAEDIISRKTDKDFINVVLPALPKGKGELFHRCLMDLIQDKGFMEREKLREAVLIYPPELFLHSLLDILSAGRETYPHVTRMDALRIIGEYRKEYCIQQIMERLHTFPVTEARDFAVVMEDYNSNLFLERAEQLLNSGDASVRASLIACLPATGTKKLRAEIKHALGDADPDVRIAAIWALIEYNETKPVSASSDLVRDPVERVRYETAKALGTIGTDASIEKLEAMFKDENEVLEVKQAVIEGLKVSKHKKAVSILTDQLSEADAELEQNIISALKEKTETAELKELVTLFKDAEPSLRDRLVQVFKLMGPSAEILLENLLRQEIESLREPIGQIFEYTGFIEKRIRELRHRDPNVRLEAAESLSLVQTKAAFRGMVLAARDPNQDVRVKVVKALERLENEQGSEILDALKNDPEKRVRKYTRWALERIKAKSL